MVAVRCAAAIEALSREVLLTMPGDVPLVLGRLLPYLVDQHNDCCKKVTIRLGYEQLLAQIQWHQNNKRDRQRAFQKSAILENRAQSGINVTM